MSDQRTLWQKLSRSKKYRHSFASSYIKRGIPYQILAMMQQRKWTQSQLAKHANLSQGVVSRAANPDYGDLTLNTIIRIAEGFDVAFIGKFVPFSGFIKELSNASGMSLHVQSFPNDTMQPAATQELETVATEPYLSDETMKLIVERNAPELPLAILNSPIYGEGYARAL